MSWNPPRAGDLGLDGTAAGLHEVAGTMVVEAVFGGVLHQLVSWISCSLTLLIFELTDYQGGRIAHRLFHTRASASTTPRLTFRATEYPSRRRSEGS